MGWPGTRFGEFDMAGHLRSTPKKAALEFRLDLFSTSSRPLLVGCEHDQAIVGVSS
jgi:hypothetical protein